MTIMIMIATITNIPMMMMMFTGSPVIRSNYCKTFIVDKVQRKNTFLVKNKRKERRMLSK